MENLSRKFGMGIRWNTRCLYGSNSASFAFFCFSGFIVWRFYVWFSVHGCWGIIFKFRSTFRWNDEIIAVEGLIENYWENEMNNLRKIMSPLSLLVVRCKPIRWRWRVGYLVGFRCLICCPNPMKGLRYYVREPMYIQGWYFLIPQISFVKKRRLLLAR